VPLSAAARPPWWAGQVHELLVATGPSALIERADGLEHSKEVGKLPVEALVTPAAPLRLY